MLAALDADFGNPSSVHSFGRRAKELVEDARDRVAAAVGASPAEIVFTGSGTEADNLALKGAAAKLRGNGNHIVTTTHRASRGSGHRRLARHAGLRGDPRCRSPPTGIVDPAIGRGRGPAEHHHRVGDGGQQRDRDDPGSRRHRGGGQGGQRPDASSTRTRSRLSATSRSTCMRGASTLLRSRPTSWVDRRESAHSSFVRRVPVAAVTSRRWSRTRECGRER